MKIAKKITHETLSCIVNLMDRKLGQSCLGGIMSFFKKLKDRLFKSSSKIDEGLEAIVQEAAEDVH